MTPVFREVKKKFPDSRLTAITTASSYGILKNNPRIDEIISVTDYQGIIKKIGLIKRLKKAKYDWGITVSPINTFINIISFWALIPERAITTYKRLGKTHKLVSVFHNHRLEYKKNTLVLRHCLNLLKFMGIKDYSEEKEIFTTSEEEKKASEFLAKQKLKSDDLLIGISVTSGVKLNEWLPDRFARVTDQFIEKLRAKIIFVGSADERSRVEEVQKMMQYDSINSCGNFKLHELPALFKKLKLFISGDVGPLYIADAVDIPVVVIVGPNNMAEQSPLGKKSRFLQKDIYCTPCASIFVGVRTCKEGHLRCLKEITVEEVFEAGRDLIITNYEKG